MGGDSYLYGTHSTPVSSLLYTACIHQPELELCGEFYCSNGGECVNDTSCQCAAGFGGESCHLAFCECRAGMWGSTLWWVRSRLSLPMCVHVGDADCNNNGRCINGHCNCTPGYGGLNCEQGKSVSLFCPIICLMFFNVCYPVHVELVGCETPCT